MGNVRTRGEELRARRLDPLRPDGAHLAGQGLEDWGSEGLTHARSAMCISQAALCSSGSSALQLRAVDQRLDTCCAGPVCEHSR